MKEDLTKYLSRKKLEEHISNIRSIVDKHYNIKSNDIRTTVRLATRKGMKEVLFENQFFIIVKDFHTKKKIEIWVLKFNRKIWLEKDKFAELKEHIECYEGYYSQFSGGFIFEFMPEQKIIEETTELIKNLL